MQVLVNLNRLLIERILIVAILFRKWV